jgi:hypothetical protein
MLRWCEGPSQPRPDGVFDMKDLASRVSFAAFKYVSSLPLWTFLQFICFAACARFSLAGYFVPLLRAGLLSPYQRDGGPRR